MNLLQLHYAKVELSGGESSRGGTGGRDEDGHRRKGDGWSSCGDGCNIGRPEDQMRDRSSWRKIYLLIKNWYYLMAHNQSIINQKISDIWPWGQVILIPRCFFHGDPNPQSRWLLSGWCPILLYKKSLERGDFSGYICHSEAGKALVGLRRSFFQVLTKAREGFAGPI